MSAEPQESAAKPSAGAPGAPLPPSFGKYVALNLGAWAFLAASGLVFAQSLGSARGIVLLCLILAAGFTLGSLFDYAWLRWGRRE